MPRPIYFFIYLKIDIVQEVGLQQLMKDNSRHQNNSNKRQLVKNNDKNISVAYANANTDGVKTY